MRASLLRQLDHCLAHRFADQVLSLAVEVPVVVVARRIGAEEVAGFDTNDVALELVVLGDRSPINPG